MSDIGTGIRSLLEAATELERTLGQVADGEQTRHVRTRLRDSVLRPLRQVAGVPIAGSGSATDPATEPPVGSARPDGSEPDSARQLHTRVPGLARTATELRVRFRDVPELTEATAALQDLAVELAETADAAELLAEFEALQAGLAPQIQPAPNGPYLVTNPRGLDDWLGRPLPVRPQMALCRCGGSQLKPLCDGTHAKIGFTDAKDPGRVPDRRDTYVGQQVTILDNRGICQHSGLCTDRLATVFHSREEPFVTPSGGRMDEIIRAVRDCPSGALSYAIDRRRPAPRSTTTRAGRR